MSVKWHRLNILKQKYDVSCHVYLDGDRTRQFTGGGRRVWGCGGAADVLHPGKRILMHYNVSQCITIKCRTIRCMTMSDNQIYDNVLHPARTARRRCCSHPCSVCIS